jgi:branched-chain amino acid transport system substrate-binding protein
MQIVWFDAITPGQSDYRATLNAIKVSGADTIYFTGYSNEAGVLIPQAKEVAPALRLTGGDATTDLALQVAGPAADGFVATTSPLPGFLPRGDAFTQAYSQRFGRLPGAGSVYEYDAVRVLAGAIFSAGSTEPKDIVEALRTTRTDGLSGEISFDAKGDRQASVYVTAIVRAGGFKPYKKLNARGEWIDG